MKFISGTLLLFALFLLFAGNAWSLPTACGSTGLLNQPTAQTLNSGNICVGLWSDYSEWGKAPDPEYDAMVVPFSITLGLGSFIEVYGSFPNLLFNDEEVDSGRGYATLGTKLRLLGKRNSLLQFAVEGQFKRAVSINPDLDGLTDFLGRGILSLKTKRFGIHGWGGVLDLEENLPAFIGPYEDVTGYGGGIEFYPTARLRVIAEADTYSERILGGEESGEWMAGFQYFVSPHLTLSVGYGGALNEPKVPYQSPETRIMVGLSTCQGIGTYDRIERKVLPPEEVVEQEDEEPVKVLKIKTLSPLLARTNPTDTSVASSEKMPEVSGLAEDVVTPVAPVIPVVAMPALLEAAPAATAVEIPVEDNQEIKLEPSQNISATEMFDEKISKHPVSPVGTPAMSSTDRPVVSTATPAKVYRRFILPEFSFEVDQYTLTPSGSAALSMIAVELSRDNKWFAMRIDGHTDATGSERYNEKLSYDRAVEYAMHLVANIGVDPNRVFVKGFGESKPITENDSVEGRAQNRRVELLVLVPSE